MLSETDQSVMLVFIFAVSSTPLHNAMFSLIDAAVLFRHAYARGVQYAIQHFLIN